MRGNVEYAVGIAFDPKIETPALVDACLPAIFRFVVLFGVQAVVAQVAIRNASCFWKAFRTGKGAVASASMARWVSLAFIESFLLSGCGPAVTLVRLEISGEFLGAFERTVAGTLFGFIQARIDRPPLLGGVFVSGRRGFADEGYHATDGFHFQLITGLETGLPPDAGRQNELVVAGDGDSFGGHYR